MTVIQVGATWRILAASAVAVSHTGDVNETTLATVTVPAGAMGANGLIRITHTWSAGANNANSKDSKVYFNGTGGTVYTTGDLNNDLRQTTITWVANRNNAALQIGFGANTTSPLGTSANAQVTSAVDTTAAVDIVFTAQLASGTDTLTLAAYLVELYYAA